MLIRRGESLIEITLTRDEVYALQDGQVVGTRPQEIAPDAKVEVLPLSALEPDNSLEHKWGHDRFSRGSELPVRAFLEADGDLHCFIPALKLSDVRITGAHIPRETIEARNTEHKQEVIERMVPSGGITLKFGGSVEIIDVSRLAQYPLEE